MKKICKLLGNQVMVALIFATMIIFSSFIFKDSSASFTIMMLIIAVYFSASASLNKNKCQNKEAEY